MYEYVLCKDMWEILRRFPGELVVDEREQYQIFRIFLPTTSNSSTTKSGVLL